MVQVKILKLRSAVLEGSLNEFLRSFPDDPRMQVRDIKITPVSDQRAYDREVLVMFDIDVSQAFNV